MNGRFVPLLTGVLVLTGVYQAQAQTPSQIVMTGSGAHVSSEPAHLYSEPITSYGPPPHGYAGAGHWQPRTPPYQPGPANRSWENLSGDDGWEYEDSPLDSFLKKLARNSFFRVEYLYWNVLDPDVTLLGAPVLGQANPTDPFPVTDTSGQLAGEARVPTTANLDLDETQGIRGTLGIPLGNGTLEGSIFYLDEVVDGNRIDDLGAPDSGDPDDLPQFVAISTLTNGQVGNNLFLFDESFRSELSADLWGAQVNYVMDSYLPEPWLKLRPIIGFRFASYEEDFRVVGVFDQQDNLADPLVSRVDAHTENEVYAPQIGLRAELSNRWFTIGVEPKFGLGVNVFEDTVVTQSFRAPADPRTEDSESGEEIAATGELNVYGRIHFRQNFTVGVGYNFTFIDNISRSTDSIFYNDVGPGPANDPAIGVDPSFDLMEYGGLNVYGELRF